jgi:hypothetical protein
MTDDIDRFIGTAPQLRFAFAIKARVGPIQDLGQTARGHRRIIDILGGEVHGPKLVGEILPGGADWQIVRPDGTIEVVARYTIRARSGALIYVQNDGLRVASPEILARMSRGERVPVDSYHFRTAPHFESRTDPRLAATRHLRRRRGAHTRPGRDRLPRGAVASQDSTTAQGPSFFPRRCRGVEGAAVPEVEPERDADIGRTSAPIAAASSRATDR